MKAMNRMGCGCDIGCACSEKGLGDASFGSGLSPWWFLIGAGAGVGLWYLFKSSVSADTGPGQTVAAPMPPITPPSRYGNLQAVAVRLDQVKTLYHSDKLSPQQALAESEGLIQAANSFSLQEGERVSEVVAAILAFEVEIQDFIDFKKANPDPVPVPTKMLPRASAYA